MTDGWSRAPVDPALLLSISGRLVHLARRGTVDPAALLSVLTELTDGKRLTVEGLAAIFGPAPVHAAFFEPRWAPEPERLGVAALQARARLRHAIHHARRRA